MSSFSSRGAGPNLGLKPEITAPGAQHLVHHSLDGSYSPPIRGGVCARLSP
ncbi:MAG: hypothetical protein ACLU9S_24050 [Oscillospiraceae bacterium]